MLKSTRIDSFGTDLIVLIAIFFLQWMKKKTSVNAICQYFNGDLLKPDAVKDSLKRLQKGDVLTVIKSGQGVVPVYNIEFSHLKNYFLLAIPSESTHYRNMRKLEDLDILDFQEGIYRFNAKGFLQFLETNGANTEEMLKGLTDTVSTLLNHSIPLITKEQFIDFIDGDEFVFLEQLISFNDDFLDLCQKALCSINEEIYGLNN